MILHLIEEGWFEKSRKGYLTLTPRALMELRGWLVNEYNDDGATKIKFCAACKDLITVVSDLPRAKKADLTVELGPTLRRHSLWWQIT